MTRTGNQFVACPKCNHGIVMSLDANREVNREVCDLCDGWQLVRLSVREEWQEKQMLELKRKFERRHE